MMSDDSQNSSGAGGRRSAGPAAGAAAAMRPPEQGLKCPRCDSPNTKFCYYNNYSLSQPRHFCKTCRRYWTKGGALRNVPVGGGCRKNKKSKSPASSRLPLVDSIDPMARFPELHGSGGGHKFLNVPPPPLAADFHIGLLPFSRLQAPAAASGVFGSNQFMSFGDISTPSNAKMSSSVGASVTTPMLGLNYPISGVGLYNEMGGGAGSASSSVANGSAHSSSIVSSIESLSSINQDLHWKLQQQRMATLFGGKAHKDGSSSSVQTPVLGSHQEDTSSFHMAERSKNDGCAGGNNRNHSSPAWFLEGSCTMSMATTSPPTNNNNNSSSNNNMNASNWAGITAWNDMPQFSTL